jgi:hypothetical protein
MDHLRIETGAIWDDAGNTNSNRNSSSAHCDWCSRRVVVLMFAFALSRMNTTSSNRMNVKSWSWDRMLLAVPVLLLCVD